MQRRLRLTVKQASVLSVILGRFADNEGDKIKMLDDSSMGSFMINEAESILKDIDTYIMKCEAQTCAIELGGQHTPETIDVGDFPIELVVDLYHLNGEKETLKEALLPHAINTALNALLTASNRYESLDGVDAVEIDSDLVREEKEIHRAIKLIAGMQ